MNKQNNMQKRIDQLMAELGRVVTDWRETSDLPPNYVRNTGDGKIKALVNQRVCLEYQPSNCPAIIGWKVEKLLSDSSQYWSGILLVNNGEPYMNRDITERKRILGEAIEAAKAEADKVFENVMQDIVPGFTFNKHITLRDEVQELISSINDDTNCKWEVTLMPTHYHGENVSGPGTMITSTITNPIFIWPVDEKHYVLENESGEELFRHTDLREVVAKSISIAFADYAVQRVIQ